MSNRTAQVTECLNKLYDLMPDGIITYEVSFSYSYEKRLFLIDRLRDSKQYFVRTFYSEGVSEYLFSERVIHIVHSPEGIFFSSTILDKIRPIISREYAKVLENIKCLLLDTFYNREIEIFDSEFNS